MHTSELPTEADDWKKRSSHKEKKRFGIQTRYKPTMRTIPLAERPGFLRAIWDDKFSEWYIAGWYKTERDRDMAFDRHNNKTPMIFPNGKKLGLQHEYRKVER